MSVVNDRQDWPLNGTVFNCVVDAAHEYIEKPLLTRIAELEAELNSKVEQAEAFHQKWRQAEAERDALRKWAAGLCQYGATTDEVRRMVEPSRWAKRGAE